MSVSLTADSVITRQKTVTRRLGWQFLKPGDQVTLCRKVMGRKPGEPLVRLAEVEIVSVRRERIDAITPDDVRREGFEGWTEHDFINFFCDHMDARDGTVVTRIEWRYL